METGMDPLKTADHAFEHIRKAGKITVSASGRRPWTVTVNCRTQAEEILTSSLPHTALTKPGKPQRVSFSVTNGSATISGHAILTSGAGKARIVPYRLIVSAPKSPDLVVERRVDTWKERKDFFAPPPSGFRFWLRAVRAVSLPLAVYPVLIAVGLILSESLPFRPLEFLLALAGAVTALLGTNLISDYFDFRKAVDTTNARSTHTGVLVDELVEPDRLLIASGIFFGLTLFIGGILFIRTGWPVLVFGGLGLFAGIFYTAGPKALKYSGLGEATSGLMMGPLITTGTSFVVSGQVTAAPLLVSTAVGLLVSAVSLANNIRDIRLDRNAGVMTFPAKIGESASFTVLILIMFVPYLLTACTLILSLSWWPLAITAFSLPMAVGIVSAVVKAWKSSNLPDAATATRLPLRIISLHSFFCLLMLAGLAGKIFFDILKK
jgi:1,4-dihydroxy-2-naphthoate octaprenyltransferase